jgi:hypothetical protein
MRLRMLLAVCAMTILATASRAAVPTGITVQGKLTDATGTPLPAGLKSFEFRIFNDTAAGIQIWPVSGAESQSIASGTDGLWIGRVGGLTSLTDSAFSGSARWLEINVNGTTLPRIRLVTGPYAFRVATVDGASGGTITSKISIGPGHTNTGPFSFVAGESNTVSADNCSVGGGFGNIASGNYAHVGGGAQNIANEAFTVVGGGRGNTAIATGATVGGGQENSASGAHATVAGGQANIASGEYSLAAGKLNTASGIYSSVTGESNTASADNCSVGGGFGNIAGGNYARVGGGAQNTANEAFTVIGGGRGNQATAPGATIGGGQFNSASGMHATVVGGTGNTASGEGSLAAGQLARANHYGSFVWNDGSNFDSLATTADYQFLIRATGGVAIGTNSVNSQFNLYEPDVSTTQTDFTQSLARAGVNLITNYTSNSYTPGLFWSAQDNNPTKPKAGIYLRETDSGTEMWIGTSNNYAAGITNNAVIDEEGDLGIGVTDPTNPLQLASGARCTAGGVWTNASDANLKENFQPVDGGEMLDKIASLPITQWNYRSETASITHIGPTAQDFLAAFGVGGDDKTISTIDPSGIALAAIQALFKRNQELESTVKELAARLERIEGGQSPPQK